MRIRTHILRFATTAGVLGALLLSAAGPASGAAHGAGPEPEPRTPIKHFVFLMQGDRTFDNYFSTYPGADGPPAGTCQALVLTRPANGCVKPFPLHGRSVAPLAPGRTVLDYQYNDGKLDGFVAAYLRQGRDGTNVMGYYDRRDLPYYWSVADQYVLFDNFFASARHGIRTNRSYWVSGAPQPGGSESATAEGYGDQVTIFDRLQSAGVSWKFYVEGFDPKETFRTHTASDPATQTARVPLLNYPRFVDDPALASHIADISEYYQDLASGSLPAVSYVSSSGSSERSARSIGAGQDLVRRMVTQLMLSPAWDSSALMWSYDGSGGWFDHVKPPTVDGKVLGPRVPALLISPFAPRGEINHSQLDYTSALKFIEDNWSLPSLGGRDATSNSIASAFDFAAPARPPVVLQPDAPAPGARVSAGTAYLGYLMAAAVAIVLFLVASAGPAVQTSLRRRQAATADPGRVHRGVVVAKVPEEVR